MSTTINNPAEQADPEKGRPVHTVRQRGRLSAVGLYPHDLHPG